MCVDKIIINNIECFLLDISSLPTMNIMRKLRGSNTSTSSGENSRPFEDDSSQHTALGLMHLKKLFTDYIHSSHLLNDKDRSIKLYTMIPLFCKVNIFIIYLFNLLKNIFKNF